MVIEVMSVMYSRIVNSNDIRFWGRIWVCILSDFLGGSYDGFKVWGCFLVFLYGLCVLSFLLVKILNIFLLYVDFIWFGKIKKCNDFRIRVLGREFVYINEELEVLVFIFLFYS